jgi:hypothetical protein
MRRRRREGGGGTTLAPQGDHCKIFTGPQHGRDPANLPVAVS